MVVYIPTAEEDEDINILITAGIKSYIVFSCNLKQSIFDLISLGLSHRKCHGDYVMNKSVYLSCYSMNNVKEYKASGSPECDTEI